MYRCQLSNTRLPTPVEKMSIFSHGFCIHDANLYIQKLDWQKLSIIAWFMQWQLDLWFWTKVYSLHSFYIKGYNKYMYDTSLKKDCY